jgi:hypothetical protein
LGLVEHGVGLADAGGRPQIDTEPPRSLDHLRSRRVQVRYRLWTAQPVWGTRR